MSKEEFDRLSLDDKEDLCREGTFVMTIQHIGQTLHLYSIADGQFGQMLVRDPEEDVISILRARSRIWQSLFRQLMLRTPCLKRVD